MLVPAAAREEFAAIENLDVTAGAVLANYTRFGIGGPAELLCETADKDAFGEALRVARQGALPHVVIGAGSNLIVADAGFQGVVLRFTGAGIQASALRVRVDAGAMLQDVVDHSVGLGWKGLETMTGIPGCVGAAIYGNAGAYGHSIEERVERVWFTDGGEVVGFSKKECEFHYRESVFKDHKDWILLEAELGFDAGDKAELTERARGIREVRDAKYPPTMRCAGSIFKNVFQADLPVTVQAEVPVRMIREGKVPSAWFLEQAGAKGMRRGDIQVAEYHANLIYNDGAGTAADLMETIGELKRRVRERFGFELEEEVQFVGFEFVGIE